MIAHSHARIPLPTDGPVWVTLDAGARREQGTCRSFRRLCRRSQHGARHDSVRDWRWWPLYGNARLGIGARRRRAKTQAVRCDGLRRDHEVGVAIRRVSGVMRRPSYLPICNLNWPTKCSPRRQDADNPGGRARLVTRPSASGVSSTVRFALPCRSPDQHDVLWQTSRVF